MHRPSGGDVSELIDAVDPVVDAALAAPLESPDLYEAAVAQIRTAAEAYYNSADLAMDDATYDALLARVAATESAHPEWKTAGSPTEVIAAGVGVGGGGEHGATSARLAQQ